MSNSEILQLLGIVAGIACMWGSLTTRLKFLESLMKKHNNFIERLTCLEQEVKDMKENGTYVKKET